MQNTKINYELEESAPPELSPTKEQVIYFPSPEKEKILLEATKKILIESVENRDISILLSLEKLVKHDYNDDIVNKLILYDEEDEVKNDLKTKPWIAIMRQLLYSHIPLVDQGNTLFHHIALEKRSNKSEKKVQDYFKAYIEIAGKLSHDPITGDYYNLDVVNKHGHTGKDILSLLDEELSSLYGVRTNEDKVQSRLHNVVTNVSSCCRRN